MKYAVEIDPGAKIYSYIPSFIKTGSGIQKLIWGGGGYTDTDRKEIAYAYFMKPG
jgi:hypothetical protein